MGEGLMNATAADVFACTSCARLSLMDSTNRSGGRPTAPSDCQCGGSEFFSRDGRATSERPASTQLEAGESSIVLAAPTADRRRRSSQPSAEHPTPPTDRPCLADPTGAGKSRRSRNWRARS